MYRLEFPAQVSTGEGGIKLSYERAGFACIGLNFNRRKRARTGDALCTSKSNKLGVSKNRGSLWWKLKFPVAVELWQTLRRHLKNKVGTLRGIKTPLCLSRIEYRVGNSRIASYGWRRYCLLRRLNRKFRTTAILEASKRRERKIEATAYCRRAKSTFHPALNCFSVSLISSINVYPVIELHALEPSRQCSICSPFFQAT